MTASRFRVSHWDGRPGIEGKESFDGARVGYDVVNVRAWSPDINGKYAVPKEIETMKRTGWWMGLIGVSALALMSAPVTAQQEKEPKKPEAKKPEPTKETKPAGEKGQAAPDPEMQKMMEQWATVSQPGEFHGHLKPLAGKWNLALKWRMAADAPWTEETSSAEITWIMGDRYLMQKVQGQPMEEDGPPFEGLGLIGYDNLRKHYASTWIDNMSTTIYTTTGTCDASGKVVTLTGEGFNPMTMKPQKEKNVYKIINNDKWVFEMYQPTPEGKEYVSMEITYTRK